MLAVHGISKRYGAVQALAEVDFAVGEGEVVALAGENGSGKSTLAKILAAAIQPDAGEVTLDGRPLSLQRPRDALDVGIAMVAQELTAVPGMSIAENVLLTRVSKAAQVIRRRRLADVASPLLDLVGVDCDPHAPFATLPAGDRELVEVAKALAASPRYLILDEATSRLGERDVERLFALLRRLREQQGMSVILITHRLREMCELADRAVVLRDGKRIGELERQRIDEERLSAMMVGRTLVDFFHKRTLEPGAPVLRVEDVQVDGAPEPVTFEVHAGEVVGIAGLVGAGRTELLETIAGVRRARGGRIVVDGRQVPPGSPRAALAAGVALVPEDRHRQGLVLGATVRENVAMGSWSALSIARTGPERLITDRAARRLRIRMAGVDVAVRALSGGNQQKVVIARCLHRGPHVLLLDEPTRGIDVGAKEEVFELIGQMLEASMAIVLVSSELLEILGLCDRILVMHERRVVGELSRAEATEERIALLSAGGQVAERTAT